MAHLIVRGPLVDCQLFFPPRFTGSKNLSTTSVRSSSTTALVRASSRSGICKRIDIFSMTRGPRGPRGHAAGNRGWPEGRLRGDDAWRQMITLPPDRGQCFNGFHLDRLILPSSAITASSSCHVPFSLACPVTHHVPEQVTRGATGVVQRDFCMGLSSSTTGRKAFVPTLGGSLRRRVAMATSTDEVNGDVSVAAVGETRRASIVHVIQPGEWLAAIARKYDVALQDVLDANPDLDADDVYDGQEILIPLRRQQEQMREGGEQDEGREKWKTDVQTQTQTQSDERRDKEVKKHEELEPAKNQKQRDSRVANVDFVETGEGESRSDLKLGERNEGGNQDSTSKVINRQAPDDKQEEEDDEEEEEEEDEEEENEEGVWESSGDGDEEHEGSRTERRTMAAPPSSMLPTEMYMVKYGDRLKLIARERGIDMRDLELLNPGVDVNNVRVGEEVLLPKVGVYRSNASSSGLHLALAAASVALFTGFIVWGAVSLIQALVRKLFSSKEEDSKNTQFGVFIPKGMELPEGAEPDPRQLRNRGEGRGHQSGKLELGTVEIRGDFAFWPWLLAHQWQRRDFAIFQTLADDVDLAAPDAGERMRQLARAWFYIDKIILLQHTYVETIFLFPVVLVAVRESGNRFAEDALTELMKQHGAIERQKDEMSRLVLHLRNYSAVQQAEVAGGSSINSWEIILKAVREEWAEFVIMYEQHMIDEEATLIPLVVQHVGMKEQQLIASRIQEYVTALDTGPFELLQLRDVARQCGRHSMEGFARSYSWWMKWFLFNRWEKTDPYYHEHRQIFRASGKS